MTLNTRETLKMFGFTSHGSRITLRKEIVPWRKCMFLDVTEYVLKFANLKISNRTNSLLVFAKSQGFLRV